MSSGKFVVPKIKLSPVGPEVSQICLGNWRWNEITKEEQAKLLEKALELGVTTIDTADIYGSYTSEELLGDLLEPKFKADPSFRSHIQLITKTTICIPNPRNNHKVHHYDTTKEHILASVERSLKYLRTTYLDVLLLHRPDALLDADEVADSLHQLHAQGKVRFFGVSNYTFFQVELLQSRLNLPLVTNQVELSPVYLDCLHDGSLDQCQKLRIVPMAWSPVRGLFDSGDRVLTGKVENERKDRILKELKAIGTELGGISEDQVVYSWIMTHPTHPIPVVGTSKPERLQKACEAVKYKLSRAQWWRIWIASKGHGVP